MKNFGNRLGYRPNNFQSNNIISDARQVLSAKRNLNNYNGNVKSGTNKSTRLYPIRLQQESRNPPKLDFTIPQKTVQNDLYTYDKQFNSSQNTKISLSTNKFSGKNFSDLNASQGIFSHSISNPRVNYTPRSYKNSSPANILNPRLSATPVAPKRSNFQVLNDMMYEPAKQRRRERDRESSVENMKFTVHNATRSPGVILTDNAKKPALSTAKFAAQKLASNSIHPGSIVTQTSKNGSLVSPIQGYRIEVKNLHPQVSVDDVYELFTSLGGELRSCNLVRPGYAEVVFRHLGEAEKSIDEFHGRELDGKPMNLKLVTAALKSPQLSIETANSEIKVKISRIQANRKPAHQMQINKDVVFRSMYATESSKVNKKPFKFSVTL